MSKSKLTKPNFVKMLTNAVIRSEHVQTGESEDRDAPNLSHWGLVWRELSFVDGSTTAYCHEYEYEKDKPKSTLSLIKTDDAWDLNLRFIVIGDDGLEIDTDELVKIIEQVRPEITKATSDDIKNLRDYPLAFDPVYQMYSLSVDNEDGQIGIANNFQEGGAVVLPDYLRGKDLSGDSQESLWQGITGGDQAEVEEIKRKIMKALFDITDDENQQNGIKCDSWSCKEISKDNNLQFMTPNIPENAYTCFNFNYEKHIVDKDMLGLLATVLGVTAYCSDKSETKKDLSDQILYSVEEIVESAIQDDYQAYNLGDSMFRVTNNVFTHRLFESMLRLPVYG
ncbi:hypothetical protein [uncultured Psychrobacter sp.]|uniref:hypothetical protein n=1 Tax=uncultured Psychrobacter sp. TaxID=259303 RepID=UPI0030DB8A3C